MLSNWIPNSRIVFFLSNPKQAKILNHIYKPCDVSSIKIKHVNNWLSNNLIINNYVIKFVKYN